jgi:hypothetical protein
MKKRGNMKRKNFSNNGTHFNFLCDAHRLGKRESAKRRRNNRVGNINKMFQTSKRGNRHAEQMGCLPDQAVLWQPRRRLTRIPWLYIVDVPSRDEGSYQTYVLRAQVK